MFNAQKDFPTVGDWHSVIQGVLEKCNMNYLEDEIRKTARGNSKKLWVSNGLSDFDSE